MEPTTLPFSWRDVYEATLCEADTTHLFTLIEIAESTRRVRLDEIGEETRHEAERDAISNALVDLMIMKTDRLHFQR